MLEFENRKIVNLKKKITKIVKLFGMSKISKTVKGTLKILNVNFYLSNRRNVAKETMNQKNAHFYELNSTQFR